VPLMLHKEGFDQKVVQALKMESPKPNLKAWEKIVQVIKNPKNEVSIGLVGKYVDLKESYKSLSEAIHHAGIALDCRVNVVYVNAEELSTRNVAQQLKKLDGILVPGGFGERGVEGKILAIQYARENKIPFFGICLGMQLASIEFARNVCGIKNATSREFDTQDGKGQRNYVIHLMEEQKGLHNKGATMRLGSFPCTLKKGSLARNIYKKDLIHERHRHRYEFNNNFRGIFEKNKMSLSGICEERDLVEIVELPKHPFFIGVQFHPEFQSKPLSPHPIFRDFIQASLKQRG
jgi:CTP synthase